MLRERTASVIKGYELHEQVGEGGYGQVYRAYQPLVGRDVAIKIILPQYANQPEFIRRFEFEAQLVARLEHPHIVPLYDYWRESDAAYLVMRWLRGGSLHAALHKGPLPIENLSRLIEEIGGALTMAHRRGVVHRDLKPANILLDEDGNAYLADFGIAKDLGAQMSPYRTDAAGALGSPAYISPEQVKGEPITPQTDIYSFGVMLYEILTGRLPFQAPTPIALMFKHVNEQVPSVRALRPDLPPAVDAIIGRATAKQAAERYSDVATLVRELRRALARDTGITHALEEPPAPPSTPVAQGDSQGRSTQASATRSHYETGLLYLPDLADITEPEVPNPYKGLRAFQEADAADFFGRELLVELLLERMRERGEFARFLAVVGPSGSGKSSVVRAGLVPALRRGALAGSENWFVIEMFPGPQPIEALAQALLRIAVDPPNNLIGPLRLDDQGLLRIIDQVVPGADETEVVLVIDQFEELFTLVEDEAARVHFLDSLIAAVTDPYSRIRVIATLRADFYDRPLLYGRFSELMRQRTELVVPLTSEELKEAIVGPAERVGLHVAPNLVETIVGDVGEQPGALPLLQYALTEVFERRSEHTLTLRPYQASGGVLGALARRAEEIYVGLSAEQQELARQLFLRLVTLGEGVEDTRRRAVRSELLPIGSSVQVLDGVIALYSQHRLLTIDRDATTRAPTVEVAHEALIRTWARLQSWLDASRDDVRLQRRLAMAAADWMAGGQERSFLASGARLEQFASWAADTHVALNAAERAFLDASLAEREAQLAQEQQRQKHELALERRSRTFLRALLAVAVVAAVLGLGLSAYAFGQRRIALDNAQRAEQSANTEATARAQANQNADAAATAQAHAQVIAAEAQNLALASGAQAALNQGKAGNIDKALALALVASQQANPAPAALYTLSNAAYRPGTRRLFDGGSRMWAVAVSPNGKQALTAARDKTLTLWDIGSGAKLSVFKGHTGVVRGVAFSPDGATAVSAAQDNNIIIWDVATGTPKFTLSGHADEVHAVAFSPDGATVLSGSDDKSLIVWDAHTGAKLRQITGHTMAIGSVAYNPTNSHQAISGSDDNTVILWDLDTGKPLRTYTGPAKEVISVAFSPDGRFIVGSSVDKNVYIWDVQAAQPIRILRGHTQQVSAVAVSPDGQLIVSGSNDSLLGVWNAATGDLIRYLNVGGQVSGVAFMPNGDQVLSTSADGTLRLWDLIDGAQVREIRQPDAVNRFALGPDGLSVLAGLNNNTAQLQPLDGSAPPHVFSGHSDVVKDVAFSPDGAMAATGANDGSLIVWNVSTGAALYQRQVPPNSSITAVAFSPDGTRLLTGGAGDNSMRLWDAIKGTLIMTFTGHTDALNAVVYRPDGRAALSVSSDRTMILWDMSSEGGAAKQLQVFKGHDAKVRDAVFTHDGSQILSASEDRTLILWDAASGKPLRRFSEHSDLVLGVALSPDGKLAISGSADNTVILWDVATGRPLRRFEGHTGAVNAVAFTKDGSQILSASSDGTIREWRLDSQAALVAWASQNRYHPPLTCEDEQLYQLATTNCS